MSPGDLKAGLQALHTIPAFLAFQDLNNWSSSDVHVEPVVYKGKQAIMSWYPLAACFRMQPRIICVIVSPACSIARH